jgi:pantetheine-phosphate adenylyltransferase
MTTAICPGSFDPVTNGHLDIIGRACALYDEVVVGVLINDNKDGLFSVAERQELLRTVTAEYSNVRVDSFQGLLVDYCRQHDISVIVKGLRAVSDFDYELQMAQMNRELGPTETVFMATNPLYSFLSSSLVKEVMRFGGDVSAHIPEAVRTALLAKIAVSP